MSTIGLDVFDRTIQASTNWIDEICDEMSWTDRHQGYHALRAVLHTLRDHIPAVVATNLASQFPMLLRGLFFEGWNPERVPVPERKQEEFLAYINDAYIFDFAVNPRKITEIVLQILSKHISSGEIDKVKRALPAGIRELWP